MDNQSCGRLRKLLPCVNSVSPEPPKPETPPLKPPSQPPEELPPDRVTNTVDRRKDEHKIDSTEDDYPSPHPPGSGSDDAQPRNNWFQDSTFETRFDDGLVFDVERGSDEVDDDSDDSSDSDSETVKTKKLTKITYEEVDENARKATSDLLDSFEKLLKYLTQPITDKRYRKRLTARAIIIWLANQHTDETDYGESKVHTPGGLLQSLKEEKMTYATCYTILCREAKLHCTLIKGYVKAAGYEPGDDSTTKTKWTAVFVEGGWQLVHPFWVCKALYGHKLGGWVKVEADGARLSETEKASKGVIGDTFKEYYFMPKPEEFIYRCYASKSSWQLLPSALIVKNKEEFLKMPYLLPPFFGLGLELLSERRCKLTTKDGKCKILLRGSSTNAHMLVLRYELFHRETDPSSKEYKKHDNMSRMVFNTRMNEVFEFDIRFPEPGEFKLVIYGGPFRSHALRLCEFKIICESPMKNGALLPFGSEQVGWGPGPHSLAAGLLLPSRINGLIYVPDIKTSTNISFTLDPQAAVSNVYTSSIHGEVGGRMKTESGKEYINSKVLDDTLSIKVRLPAEGEFGVSISCQNTETRLEKKTVCNYLLTTTKTKYDKANIKNAKRDLREACESHLHLPKKVESIRSQIKKCRKEKIAEHDEDLCAAISQYQYFFLKNELRDALMRDRVDVALKTLKRLDKYKYKAALKLDIEKVGNLVVDHGGDLGALDSINMKSDNINI